MAREFIITGFGLSAFKPALYRGQLGQPLETNGSDFPEQSIEEFQPLDLTADDQIKLSFLGTPIFSDLRLRDNESGIEFYTETVLFDISLPKNIVKTPIPGRPGTIKEYIAEDDYQVNIKGAIVNHGSNNYPLEDVNYFVQLMRLPRSLEVMSQLLQLYGIHNLVVEDFKLPSYQGFQNTQLFEITGVSDEPVELIEEL